MKQVQIPIRKLDEKGEVVEIHQSSKVTYPVAADDLLVIPKNCPHAFASSHEGLRELIINIPGIELHDNQRIVWI